MYYRPSSPEAFFLAIITLLVIKIISTLFSPNKNKKSKAMTTLDTIKAVYGREKTDRCMDRLQAAVKRHNDYTMETINFLVTDPEKAKLSKSMLPGDSIDFNIKNGKIRIYKNYVFIASTLLPEDSRLKSPELKFTPKAIVVTHDWSFSVMSKDFITVAFFYKIDGVPPTRVNITED